MTSRLNLDVAAANAVIPLLEMAFRETAVCWNNRWG